jgi:hypothetical protein
MPFSRSKHSPRTTARGLHHAQKPSTDNPPPPVHDHPVTTHGRRPRFGPATRQTSRSAHIRSARHRRPQPATRPAGQTPKDRHRPRRKRIRQIVPTPLNTRHADTRGHARNTRTTHPVRHAPTQRDKPAPNAAASRPPHPAQARLARPETHQNLIHPDKEQHGSENIVSTETTSRTRHAMTARPRPTPRHAPTRRTDNLAAIQPPDLSRQTRDNHAPEPAGTPT